MRARWIAGIFAVSAVALVTAASLAQRPERPRQPPSEPAADRKVWRSKAEPLAVGTPSRTVESTTVEPGQAAEDPMVAVEAFLRRNREEADDSIRALTLEADALRARLAKVEAALARWQAVAGSLSPGRKWTQPDGISDPGLDLSPIDPAPGPPGAAKPPVGPTSTSPSDPAGTPSPRIVLPPAGDERPPTILEPSKAPTPADPGPIPEPR